MAEHNYVGKVGEELAAKYLEKEGYKILEKNYRTRWLEIDIIAEKPGGFFGKPALVFVEVRTKVGEKFGSPEETINKAKLKKVLFSAQNYAAFKKWDGPCRIDAICIVLKVDLSVLRLTHYENIIAG